MPAEPFSPPPAAPPAGSPAPAASLQQAAEHSTPHPGGSSSGGTGPKPAADWLAVLNFGGQYAHLIAKRLRQMGWAAKVLSPQAPSTLLGTARGIVLSGGPASVHDAEAPPYNAEVLRSGQPVLGLCYGHQLLSLLHQGRVEQQVRGGEYGVAQLELTPAGREHPLLQGLAETSRVWMSHGDTVAEAPPGFQILATTANSPVAAMAHPQLPLFSLQYHPEVQDSEGGDRVLANFAQLCGARPSWSIQGELETMLEDCRRQAAGRNVLVFLSGGVDSSVAFALLLRALGPERVRGLLLDTGFMRRQEIQETLHTLQELGWGASVHTKDASDTFYQAVEGLSDPQAKRRALGLAFLDAREEALTELNLKPDQWLLGQGTLYSDVIESGGEEHAQTIKHHHNRIPGLAALLEAGMVVEPLRDLYKDEVRLLGRTLGLPQALVQRQPFPGPGLAINVLCARNTQPPPGWRAADQVMRQALADRGLRGGALPVRSVGVQGDRRTYAAAGFVVHPQADWNELELLSSDLTNSLPEINRVVLQLNPRHTPLNLAPHTAFCTRERVELLREADYLTTKTLQEADCLRHIFQLLVILLPLAPAAVMPGEHTVHDEAGACLVLRPIVSEDVMTGRFARLPWETIRPLGDQLMALPTIQAVFYDITHKPPATFGWE